MAELRSRRSNLAVPGSNPRFLEKAKGLPADRIEVIVRFLAVLELFKQGYVDLEQPQRFGDIEVAWCAPDDVSTESILIDAYDG